MNTGSNATAAHDPAHGREIDAFEALMRKHNRLLYRTARSIVRNDGDAEDCVQEAFLHAWRHRDQFRGEAAPSTWLTRIVINEALQKLRRGKGEAGTLAIDNVFDLDAHLDGNANFPSRLASPDTVTLRNELCALLERKIDELPAAFRTVFMLRAIEEMSVEETAACLAIPEATVRTRLFRARSLLRESIASDVDLAMGSAFEFMGERCDRIVANVLRKIADGDPPTTISQENK
jgi:RNA polymerase sigma-70 factor (ECF subfamily)